MPGRLFARRRDGRVEVRLNDSGRALVREYFVRVVAAERDPSHEWQASLNAPIVPAADHDDPLATLSRQNEIASNAELAAVTVDERYLSDAEAWAWLTTLQVALRATAQQYGVFTEEALSRAEARQVDEIHVIQQLLFELSACL